MALEKTYFLDIAVWAQYGFTNTNTDPKKLNPIIQRVQKNRIEPILGTTLYNKMVTIVDDATIEDPANAIYKTLMDDFLLDTLIAYCDWKYTFHGTSQMTNKTVGTNNDEHITANSVEANNNLRNECIKDAKQFERKMIGWLQDNRLLLPEYCDTPTDKCHQSIKPSKGGEGDYDGRISII